MTSDEDRPSIKRARVSNVTNDHDIPSSSHYQVSYAHKAVVTFIEYSLKHDMVLTASQDGIIKFWKRTSQASSSVMAADNAKAMESSGQCVEFIKSYIAHTAPPTALTMSYPDGDAAASMGEDNIIKFYDVGGFDVSGMIRVAESYECGESATFVGEDQTLLAVSSSKSSGSIFIFSSVTLAPTPVKEIKLHAAVVVDMKYNYQYHCVVSVDQKGVIEYWNGSMNFSKGSTSMKERNIATIQDYDTVSDDHESFSDKDQQDINQSTFSPLGEAPTMERNGIELKSKMDTDLLTLLRKKTHAVSLSMSPTGSHFVVYAEDRKVRLFHFKSGKVVVQYDERMKTYDAQVQKKFSAGELAYEMDSIAYGNRVAREREMADTTILNRMVDETYQECGHQKMIVHFDSTGKLLILPTMVGLKVIDWSTNKCRKIIGMGDSATLRFIGGCQPCLGPAKVDKQMQLARSAALGGPESSVTMQRDTPKNDSIVISMAFNKRRFYIFSHVDPVDENGDETEQQNVIISRDILNEPPDADDLMLTSMEGYGKKKSILGKEAILRTTMGDIHIRLYPNETPKTVENFCTHSKNGYYDNVIFHRVIKGFMIQTGDPFGDGTGGESIWGGEFEDECVRELRHDRPFTVSMANAGPNTNGSQFFITTVPTPWLDNKHTVFGRVIRGMDVCTAIENVKVDEMDKPLNEISIMSIDIV